LGVAQRSATVKFDNSKERYSRWKLIPVNAKTLGDRLLLKRIEADLPQPEVAIMEDAIQQRLKKCPGYKNWFKPDPRTSFHQRFCKRPHCRKASKISSQKRWRAKPGNHNLGGGPKEVARVRKWRKLNPDYWKRVFRLLHQG